MVVPETRSPLSKNFQLRVVSAIILLPVITIIIYNGSWIFVSFLSLLSFIALIEWNKLIGFHLVNFRSYIPSLLMSASIVVVAIPSNQIGLILLSLSCLSNLMIGRLERCQLLLAMLGPLYIFLPCWCLIWLREFPHYGFEMVFWLLLVVSTTDTCAYLFGRIIKGPKLAPKLSPGKTWSGSVFGVFCAILVGAIISSHLFDVEIFIGNWEWAAGLALLVAVFAQLGDLAESWLKRKMDVKDSGTLIPGHGGLLDRVDSFMVSSPLMVIFILCLT